MIGTALIYNDKYSKKIGIRLGPVNHIELYVNQYGSGADGNNVQIGENLKNLLGDLSANWLMIKDNFILVDLDTYPGFTKLQKFELFLAHYSTQNLIK
jgi:hypothetical protein